MPRTREKPYAVIAHNYEGTGKDALVGLAGTIGKARALRERYYTDAQPEKDADIIRFNEGMVNPLTFLDPYGLLAAR